MKKLLLLLAGGMAALGADAQYAKQTVGGANLGPKTRATSQTSNKKTTPYKHSAARTTATCFYTEDFGSGTTSTLPTNWTAGIMPGGGSSTWHWANTASTSTFSMGVMNSTTAANGWMIFDSDGIGAACGTCSPTGWLQSPAINCASHSTVRLTFENYYRKYRDSSSVWVGTDPTFTAGTYHVYPVNLNNNTAHNASTTNPSTVNINISGAAGGQATVYIRFISYGYAAGSYSWMIDDICMSELDAHDVGIHNGVLDLVDRGTGVTAYNGSYFSTPLQMVDSVVPLGFVSNYGANVENVNTSIQIWKSGTSVYTDNYTYTALPIDSEDSLVVFSPYKATATGSYACTLSATVTGDAVSSNDVDSMFFNITDTLWQQNASNAPIGSAGLYNPAIGSSPISTYMQGTRFDVPTTITAGDTVSGFGVAFGSTSTATGAGKVSIQLYSTQNDASITSWTYLGTSVARSLTTADYSTSTAIVWSDFRIDMAASGGIDPFVLQPGFSYAAMIQVNGVTSPLTVLTTDANPLAPNYVGYFGQSDSSDNAGGQDFGATLATGNPAEVPMIRMYLGKVPPVAVQNVTYANKIGKAYPNPANTSVNIPFTLGSNGVVTVTLSNVVGQVVKTQQINAVGGQQTTATFNTSDLTAGIYLYTVNIDGHQTTGRVSVSH